VRSTFYAFSTDAAAAAAAAAAIFKNATPACTESEL
jgi:hypothetical protein